MTKFLKNADVTGYISQTSVTSSLVKTDANGKLVAAASGTDYVAPSGLDSYVPYTGATANVNLGAFDLTADVITGATGSLTSSGSGNTLSINHSSGSGIALNITKAGNGEGLYINKTSGSGNAATIVGTLNATTLVKSGGTSAQFLKADGSVDSTAYGTGTVTSVAALTLGTTGTDLSSTVATGTTTPVITLNVPTASATNRGALSSADWTTFNSKQNALTNPVTGSLTTNYIPRATGANTIVNSVIYQNGTNIGIGITAANGLLQFSNDTNSRKIVLYEGANNDFQFYGFGINSATLVYSVFSTTDDHVFFAGASPTTRNELLRIKGNGTIIAKNSSSVAGLSATINATGEYMSTGALSGYFWENRSGGVTSNSNWYGWYTTSGLIKLYNGSSNLLSISGTSGNMSIGSDTDAGYKLDVNGTGRFSGALSGTSASFSGKIGTSLSSSGVNFNNASFYVNNTANTKGAIFGYDDTADEFYFNSLQYGVAFKPINFGTAAAKFSSSVTATNNVTISAANYPQIVFAETTSSTNALIFYDNVANPKQLGIRVNSASNVMTLTSTNVGIGTTAPSEKLSIIGGDVSISSTKRFYLDAGFGFLYLTSTGNNGAMQFYAGDTERMRITSDGLLQFSTTSVVPNTNNIINSYGPNGYFYIQGGTTGLALAGSGNRNNAVYVNTAENFISFHTNNVGERMRITAAGNLLIGTTTDAGAKFRVHYDGGNGADGLSSYNILATTASTSSTFQATIGAIHPGDGYGNLNLGGNGVFWHISKRTSIDAHQLQYFYFNGSTFISRFIFSTSGNLTATAFFEASDMRLKKLIEHNPIVKGIENLMAKLYEKEGKIEIGYFAQDAELIMPYAVTKGSGGFLSLSYREVHTAKIARLEKEVEELKSQLARL